jgi:hypothetical protein
VQLKLATLADAGLISRTQTENHIFYRPNVISHPAKNANPDI